MEEIKKIRLPERFIAGSGVSISYPARVASSDFGPADTSQVERIEDGEFCHYAVRLSQRNLPNNPIALDVSVSSVSSGPKVLATCAPADVQARVPDPTKDERARVRRHVSPVNLMGADIALNYSSVGIDVVFILTNQLERIVERPSRDAESDRPEAIGAFDPERNQEWAGVGHGC